LARATARVQRALGLPSALFYKGNDHTNLGRMMSREAKLYPRHCERTQSSLSLADRAHIPPHVAALLSK
jgi:hypothetical protein